MSSGGCLRIILDRELYLDNGQWSHVTLAVTCLLLKEVYSSYGVSFRGRQSVREEMSYAMDERLGY